MRTLVILALAIALSVLFVRGCDDADASDAAQRGEFAAAVIRELNAPVTLHTRRAMQAEMQAEGGSAINNPFNTTLRLPGSTNYNWVPVQNYLTPAQGVEATVKTLKQRCCGYWRIRQALRANASAGEIVRAFGRSLWGTSLTLVLAVLDDIRHDRSPNTLTALEARYIPAG
jgi:hypothetical protein